MDFSAYTDILWNTVSFQLKFLSVIVVICLIPEIWYMTTKIKMKRSEGRTWEDISTGFILVAIFLCCYVLPSVVPMIKDIAVEHYLSAHGQYTIEVAPASKGSPRREMIILITDDGEKLVLDYTKDGSEIIGLPEDGGSGTVWYSENSKRILEYIPDEPSEDG